MEDLLNLFVKSIFIENVTIKKDVTSKEKEKTIYTNKDKFNKMLEDNNTIKELQSELGLDPDY